MALEGMNLEIDNCIFRDNVVTGDGGAVANLNGLVTITDSVFEGNAAYRGGAVASTIGGEITLRNCVFRRNAANEGGAVMIDAVLAGTIENCTFAHNVSGTGANLSLRDLAGGPVMVRNSILAFGSGVGGAVALDAGSTAFFLCTDVYGNQGGDWTGALVSQADANGNLSVDPLFCGGDDPYGPLLLTVESPCTAAAQPSCGALGALPVGCTVSGVGDAPRAVRLLAPSPNPFNPATTIAYELDAPGFVTLRIYDLAGSPVRTLVSGESQGSGLHQRRWDGRDDAGRAAPAGVYHARLRAGRENDVARMVLIK